MITKSSTQNDNTQAAVVSAVRDENTSTKKNRDKERSLKVHQEFN